MQRFKIKSDVVFGEGALSSLANIKGQHVLLVTDQFMSSHGVAESVASHLSDCQVTILDNVVPDPPIDIVASGVSALEASGAQTILALGGGSVIDAAKAIRQVFASSREDAPHIPLIAVPTTSGTGSEVTAYAVISDPAKGAKYPLASEDLLPDLAVLDPSLTSSVPPAITADTGLDVLTHAIEAYVSRGSTEFTDALASHAIDLVFTYLPRAFKDGADTEARDKMHVASCMAGMAFSEAGLGCAHGCAHAIGARFHLPHGRACGLVLPEVMKFNADLDGVRGGEYSLAARKYAKLAGLLGLSAASVRLGAMNLIREVERLRAFLGAPASLKDAGVDPVEAQTQLADIAELAAADATSSSNPRPAAVADTRAMIEHLIRG